MLRRSRCVSGFSLNSWNYFFDFTERLLLQVLYPSGLIICRVVEVDNPGTTTVVAGLAFDRSMADLLCRRSFLSCKDNTLNV